MLDSTRALRRSVPWRCLAAVGLLLTVVACGSDKPSGGTTASSASSSSTPAEENVDPTGSVRIAYPAGSLGLDPHRQRIVTEQIYTFLVYDRLLLLDPDTYELKPMLATSWKFAADGTSLELKLRDDVTFHDGTKFDATAVKANMDRELALPDGTGKLLLTAIQATTVVDPTTVRFTLTPGRGAELPASLATYAGAMISPKALADPARDLAKTPGDAGSGPYLLTTYDPAVKYSFQKAPGTYWDPKAGRLASLEVQIISSTAARVNALKSGQVDLAHVQAPEAADVAKEAEAGAAFKAYKRDKFFSMHNLMLHAANGKLADQRVRQAISYAIDREGIAQGLLNGACTPAYQPYPDGHWANDPNLKTPYTLDVAKAKQLITDAGASGTAMEIIVAANTPFQLIAEAVQSQLKDIGINATITPKATAADSAAAFRGGAGDGFESSIVGTADPSVLLQENYLAGYGLIADPAAKTEIQNLANQALDPKLDQAARGKIYRDVWNKLSTAVWDVKICRTFQTYGYAPKVHGVEQMGWTFSGVFDARTLWVSK